MANKLLIGTMVFFLVCTHLLLAQNEVLERTYAKLVQETPEESATRLLAIILQRADFSNEIADEFINDLPELVEVERKELLDTLQLFLELERKDTPQRLLALDCLTAIVEKEAVSLRRKVKRSLISISAAKRERARLSGLTDGLALSLILNSRAKKSLAKARTVLEKLQLELPKPMFPKSSFLYFIPLLLVGSLAWYIGHRQGKSTRTPLDNKLLLAEIHFRNKHFAKALAAYRDVLADPGLVNSTNIRARLCLALAALGKTETALVNLNEIDIKKLNHAIVYELGKAFQKLGKFSTALELFNNVYSRARDYRKVAERIEEISQLSAANLVDECALERILAPRYANPILLGKGAMGMVYKVKDRQLRQNVAVKIISPLIGESQALRKRFVREIKSLAALDHKGIVKILDYKLGDVPFYAMEFIEGRPLNRLLSSNELQGRYDRINRIALFVTDALAYAAQKGVLHRDIKPANVLVVSRDRAKLIDFGVAKLLGSTTLTAHEAAVGTPLYLAPEVLNGKQQDEASEVYAVGVLLYEMIIGFPPWTFEQLMFRSNPSTPSLQEREPGCPGALVNIVNRCLEPEPEKRYAGLSDLAKELAKSIKDQSHESSGIETSS